MSLLSYFDRVYINLPETYNEPNVFSESPNLMKLIEEVARVNPSGDSDMQLYDIDTQMFYARRTKIYVVKKTKEFILGMPERFSLEENMATFVSLRQLKNLIKSFEHDKKRISCYGLIYLYVIYTLLHGKSSIAAECSEYIKALYNIIYKYFEDNPDDQLAEFFYECYAPIIRAIQDEDIALPNNQLPPVPRNHPHDEE